MLRKDFDFEKHKLIQKVPSSLGLIEPKEIEINGNTFIISKMPCTVAQEVLFKLPTGLMPFIKDFNQSQEMAFKMLWYCLRCYSDKEPIQLTSKALIDAHVPDFDTLIKLEKECVSYNFDFFQGGKVWDSLNKVVSLAESKASGILTDLLDRLLQVGKQP